MRFAGKNIVITGGTRGIGRAIVERLLAEGARVCFSGRKQETVDSAVAELSASYGTNRVLGVVAHLGRENRTAVVEAAVDHWGTINGLVLNAAISPPITSVIDADRKGFEKILGTNVTANALLVQAAADHFVEGDSSIVFISSVAAYRPKFPLPVYGVSKTALHGLASAFAAELGPDGVRVNIVSPGVIRTDFSKMIWGNKTVAESISQQTMLGRLGQPKDVAGAVAFLLSDDAAYITAESITVAGGSQSRL